MAATIDIEKAEATQSTPKINNHSDRIAGDGSISEKVFRAVG